MQNWVKAINSVFWHPCPSQSIQWLRHGCLPVIVVEGRAPAEKLAAVQARYAARNGVDGGGRGSSSFIALGKSVGVMLQQLVGAELESSGAAWRELGGTEGRT